MSLQRTGITFFFGILMEINFMSTKEKKNKNKILKYFGPVHEAFFFYITYLILKFLLHSVASPFSPRSACSQGVGGGGREMSSKRKKQTNSDECKKKIKKKKSWYQTVCKSLDVTAPTRGQAVKAVRTSVQHPRGC